MQEPEKIAARGDASPTPSRDSVDAGNICNFGNAVTTPGPDMCAVTEISGILHVSGIVDNVNICNTRDVPGFPRLLEPWLSVVPLISVICIVSRKPPVHQSPVYLRSR